MLPLELLDSFSDTFLHALLNNFLSLFLNQIVAIVLWHFLICRCWETHNWLGTSMAHINPDQHCPLCVQRLWELEVIEVTTCFRVYLSQDVGRFWQIKLEPVSRGYNLTRHPVLVHHFFEGLIGTFLLQQKDDHSWMSDFTTSEHVVSELFIELVLVGLPWQLDPVRLFDSKLQLRWGFDHILVDLLRDRKNSVVFLINKDPLC